LFAQFTILIQLAALAAVATAAAVAVAPDTVDKRLITKRLITRVLFFRSMSLSRHCRAYLLILTGVTSEAFTVNCNNINWQNY
jgi:hypothetical protein